ncbi:MAG TPA: protein-disulfide reductase DsbD domain-containing protein [Gemmatimonadales bacterium]
MIPAGSVLTLTLAAAWFAPGLAAQARVRNPHVTISLVPERTAALPGASLRAGLRFRLENGWHIYWRNPGEAGIATHPVWRLPAGWKVDPLSWPVPERYDVAGSTTHIHRGDVVFGTRFHVPATGLGTARIAVELSYGICRDVCVPGKAELGIAIPVGREGMVPDEWPRVAFLWTARAPRQGGPAVEASLQDSVVLVRLRGSPGAALTAGTWTFFPADRSVAPAAMTAQARPGSRELVLRLPLAQCTPIRLNGILVQGDPTVPYPKGYVVSAPLTARPTC